MLTWQDVRLEPDGLWAYIPAAFHTPVCGVEEGAACRLSLFTILS